MKNRFSWMGSFLGCMLLIGCTAKEIETVNSYPNIFPDYRFATVPVNIAPLNFQLEGKDKIEASFFIEEEEVLKAKGSSYLDITIKKWHKVLAKAAGKRILIEVRGLDESNNKWYVYKPFFIAVSEDSIDSHIAYRLIEPGYEMWKNMGLYQRDLTSFTEKPILENSLTNNGCLNCHSFCNYSPKRFQFHSRQNNPGTILVTETIKQRLNLKSDSLIANCVYPFWHPSGNFIMYSINNTRQLFHAYNRNKIEVYDIESDLVLYDVNRNEIITDDRFITKDAMETYPTWSPDGKWLYFCKALPVDIFYEPFQLKYGIYRVAFDAETKKFGDTIETVIDPAVTGKTHLFPRISPNGRYLMYAEAAYGYFSIWHREADLKVLDLQTGRPVSTAALNSREAESYHSWSSTGKWVIYGSRRLDTQYTRLFIAHCNKNGTFSKPFLLPQRDPNLNTFLLKSYNIPEFITGEVTISPYELENIVKGDIKQATLAQ